MEVDLLVAAADCDDVAVADADAVDGVAVARLNE